MRCETHQKKIYAGKREARTAANEIMKGKRRHGMRKKLGVYPCPDCGGWHLRDDGKRYKSRRDFTKAYVKPWKPGSKGRRLRKDENPTPLAA